MSGNYCLLQLQMALRSHLIASLYTQQDDPDSFVAGYVDALSHSHVLLHSINPWGRTDGYLLQRVEDLDEVYIADDYETRLQMLQDSYQENYIPFFTHEISADANLPSLLLKKAQKENLLLSVQVDDETYLGRVLQVDDLHVTLNLLDFFAVPEGSQFFTLNQISCITLKSQEEALYERLENMQMRLL